MRDFILGVGSSVAATTLVWWFVKLLLPYLQDKFFYRGVRVDGMWDIVEVRDGQRKSVGKMTLEPRGSRIRGRSRRSQTREGLPSNREFVYSGRIAGEQVTLLFEDARGRDFDTGSYIFRLLNDCVTMQGVATFNGKKENGIIAEQRLLLKCPLVPAH